MGCNAEGQVHPQLGSLGEANLDRWTTDVLSSIFILLPSNVISGS
jgi:hypothetical protein